MILSVQVPSFAASRTSCIKSCTGKLPSNVGIKVETEWIFIAETGFVVAPALEGVDIVQIVSRI